MAGVGPKFLKALAEDYLQLRPVQSQGPEALVLWERMVRSTSAHLATANPNFQTARFLEAAGMWPSAVQ